MYKGYLRNGLICTLIALFVGILSVIIGYFATPYKNTLVEYPLAVLVTIVILIVFGFIIGISLGYFLRRITLKEWIKDGTLGIIFVLALSFALTIYVIYFSFSVINPLLIFIYSFLIWIIPGFLFGVLSGFILKKLRIE